MTTNKIETLRAICFTKDDMENITNLGDLFSDVDIDFMVEFKKIYELGLGQLEKFINKLDTEGKDLDTYSIQYYIDILHNGPLGNFVRELSIDKNYFVETPEIMGLLGNKSSSSSNTTLYFDRTKFIGCHVNTFNKLPTFMQTNLLASVSQTEDVFRSSLNSSIIIDNTLPIADKNPQLRYDEEYSGKWVLRSNGSFMVKDSYYYRAIEDISEQIFDKIKLELGDENFRMYSEKKLYNAFDLEKNTSISTNTTINKKIINNDVETIVETDLLGDELDSEAKRGNILKISNDVKDVEYKLNTNIGQLGS